MHGRLVCKTQDQKKKKRAESDIAGLWAKNKTKPDMNREKYGFKTRIMLKIRLKNSRNILGQL